MNLTKEQVLQIIAGQKNGSRDLIAVLLEIQAASGKNYIDKQWAELVASETQIPVSKIYEVLTFYSMLKTEPRGKYVIEVCKSTPCYFCAEKHTIHDSVVKWLEEKNA